MKPQSTLARSLTFAASSSRMRLMRSRMAPSSCSQSARSSGELSTAAASWLPGVLPARIADPDFGIRAHALQKIRADLEAPGAAKRLHGDDALLLKRRRV